MHVQIHVSLISRLLRIFANFFRFFENYGLTNHLHHPIMQLNKNKPLEEREVESILAIAENRRRWECGIAGLSNGLSEGPVNGLSPY